jgi:hypothetical protein
MSDTILAALIAAIISFVVSLVGFGAAILTVRGKIREVEFALRNKFTETLLLERINAYGEALRFTKVLTRMPSMEKTFDKETITRVRADLGEFLNSKSGLLLSKDALTAVDEFRDSLSLNFGGSDRYSRDQLEKIVKSANAFRQALRNDVNPIHNIVVKHSRLIDQK